MAITLLPFRQYDEHDVINMYTFDVSAATDGTGTSPTNGVQASAGLIVDILGNGFQAGADIHDLSATQPNAAVNDNGYSGTLSLRYNLKAEVNAFDGTSNGARPLGMLLHDVRTLDENGEDLRYNPRKADEMNVVVPGQAVPVVSRGIFLLKETTSTLLASASANDLLYSTSAGVWTDNAGDSNDEPIGMALGAWDSTTNSILVKLGL